MGAPKSPPACRDLFPSVSHTFVSLPSKPSASIAHIFVPGSGGSSTLVVFLNSGGLPMFSWLPTITALLSLPNLTRTPSILAYDRYGQGLTTARDPDDAHAPEPAHDCLSAVRDLHELITTVLTSHNVPTRHPRLVLIGNSVGCALARLYAQSYPRTVAGMILLDSLLANSDYVSIFPDPDRPDFQLSELPREITPDDLRQMRDRMSKTFHPSVGSSEGLSRRNLASLLPDAGAPQLDGWGGEPPFVTVVGHGWEAFAQEGLEWMGTPKALNYEYLDPFWFQYNRELCEITVPDRRKGPLEAIGAGHFIHADRPDLVVKEIWRILEKLGPDPPNPPSPPLESRIASRRWSFRAPPSPSLEGMRVSKRLSLRERSSSFLNFIMNQE